jgi:hypothetical protein
MQIEAERPYLHDQIFEVWDDGTPTRRLPAISVEP